MSLSVISQPSLEITGRVGSSARVRWYSAEISARCSARSAASATPQLSLIGTQVTIEGWLRSRRTTSSHSRVSRSTARGEKA